MTTPYSPQTIPPDYFPDGASVRCVRLKGANMKDYSIIVNDAAVKAVAEAKTLAMQGNCEPLRLYYRKEELRITALLLPDNVGWTDSGKTLKSNVPYSRYGSWLFKEARSLPIFA